MASSTNATIIAAVITAVATVISALGGAYAQHYLSIQNAPEQTIAGTSTLVGFSEEAIELAKSQNVAPEIVQRLDQIREHARAVEASAELLQKPAGVVSNQADFWLRMDSGATLGETTSFGVTNRRSNGVIDVVVNNKIESKEPGGRVDFKTQSGDACFATYIGTSPDNSLFGFKVHCGVINKEAS
ncbi:hypothetical protein [Thiorhodococcus fuscus]|uniref:Uncharacterized protein n=1 Tax=Thiorhodococcus fuscus TaxID=527200 RepID=A0ABW4Y3V4_9GAMM